MISNEKRLLESATLKLLGSFSEDHKSGLLKESQIFACKEENADEISFLVPPGGTALDVVFCGSFSGFPLKQNRLLPEIQIIVAQRQKLEGEG